MKTVTVIGGGGVVGRRICAELERAGLARVRLAGRDSEASRAVAHRNGLEFRPCSLRDARSLGEAIDGSTVVIDAAGPFQTRDLTAASACIEAGIHYIDVAGARSHVLGVAALDAPSLHRGVLVTSGATLMPALSAAMLDETASAFERISDICVAITLGARNRHGEGTTASVLDGLGRRFRMTSQDKDRLVRGGDDPRALDFPAPTGTRVVSFFNAPDVALFPERYAASTVRVYCGIEGRMATFALSLVRWVRRYLYDVDLMPWSALAHRVLGSMVPGGSGGESLAVWVRGTDADQRPLQRRLALVSTKDEPVLESTPAVLLAERIVTQGPPRVGALPCTDVLSFGELKTALTRRGVKVFKGDAYEWEEC